MPNNIKQVRKSLGISVTELAQKLNMSQGNLTKIENGLVELKAETAQAIADILQCPLEKILPAPAVQSSPLALHLNLPADSRFVSIKDDAMAPSLAIGDTAVIRPQSAKKEDGIYVVQTSIGRGEIIRRLQTLSDGKIAVICDNHAYQTEYASTAELDITGRVICRISVTPTA